MSKKVLEVKVIGSTGDPIKVETDVESGGSEYSAGAGIAISEENVVSVKYNEESLELDANGKLKVKAAAPQPVVPSLTFAMSSGAVTWLYGGSPKLLVMGEDGNPVDPATIEGLEVGAVYKFLCKMSAGATSLQDASSVAVAVSGTKAIGATVGAEAYFSLQEVEVTKAGTEETAQALMLTKSDEEVATIWANVVDVVKIG